MDPFYYDMQGDIIVDDDDYLATLGGAILPPALQGSASAFAAYQQGTAATSMERHSSVGGSNVHQRMFGYLRRIGDGAAAGSKGNGIVDAHSSDPADRDATTSQAPRGSSRFRHIMRERLRRERLSQGFADLHALLPAGASKGGKNDIVSAAAGYIRDLEGRKQWLRARNDGLLEQAARAGSSMVVVKVRAESDQRSVAVDVFETVLRRLKAMEEVRVTGIRSCFQHDGGMWMDIAVRCEVPSRDVDKAITNALMKEVEENALGVQVPRSSNPVLSCQVEYGRAPNVLTF